MRALCTLYCARLMGVGGAAAAATLPPPPQAPHARGGPCIAMHARTWICLRRLFLSLRCFHLRRNIGSSICSRKSSYACVWSHSTQREGRAASKGGSRGVSVSICVSTASARGRKLAQRVCCRCVSMCATCQGRVSVGGVHVGMGGKGGGEGCEGEGGRVRGGQGRTGLASVYESIWM